MRCATNLKSVRGLELFQQSFYLLYIYIYIYIYICVSVHVYVCVCVYIIYIYYNFFSPFISLTGYSITSGRFDKSGHYYATGAPRSNETGQVLLIAHRSAAENFLRFDRNRVFSGDQFGSSFGYSVAAVDLNNDRWVSLSLYLILSFLIIQNNLL